jgi:hypothetical protein
MDDTAKLVAIIVLSAFAIERITATIDWTFDSARLYRDRAEGAAERRAKHHRHLALLVIAGALSLAVIAIADLRILRVLKLTSAPPAVDFWLTWLILFAGADRVRAMLQGGEESGGGSERSEAPAFRIHVDNNAEIREIPRAS